MDVKVKKIVTSTTPQCLGDVTVELTDSDGDSLLISEIRVFQQIGRRELFLTMPKPAVCECNRSYGYIPQIVPNRQLLRKVQNAVLDAVLDTVLASYKKSKAEVQA